MKSIEIAKLLNEKYRDKDILEEETFESMTKYSLLDAIHKLMEDDKDELQGNN